MTFTEKVLGSQPGDPELLAKHIAARAPEAEQRDEEVAAFSVGEEFEKGSTVFARDEQGRFLWNYQIAGFFKENLGLLIELGEVKTVSKWMCKRAVFGLVTVQPRRIRLLDPAGQPFLGEVSFLQRSARVDTMQGPRVCLVSSEELPPGSSAEFRVRLLTGGNPKSKMALTKRHLLDCFDYAAERGFGQWRSAGHGAFAWREVPV